MNINIGKEYEHETNERMDFYDKMTGNKIILLDVEMIKEYDYKRAVVEKIVNPEQYKFSDRYLGGVIHKCAVLKDSPYVLLVDKFFNTVGVFLPAENMHKLKITELADICKRHKIEVLPEDKKDNLIEKLQNI